MRLFSNRHVIAAAACLLVFLSNPFERKVVVSEQMTWECAPEEYKTGYYARPDEYVRFRFVKNPRCVELESARNLCADLRSMGKQVVTAEFEVWGGPFHLAPEGYSMKAVEGHQLVHVGGWGYSGANDPKGPCPIWPVIQRLRQLP